MDRTRFVSRIVFDGWREENFSDCAGKGKDGTDEKLFRWNGALHWDLGNARRAGAYSSAGNGHPAVADSSRRNWADRHSSAGNLYCTSTPKRI